jgi:hypothetical protein
MILYETSNHSTTYAFSGNLGRIMVQFSQKEKKTTWMLRGQFHVIDKLLV